MRSIGFECQKGKQGSRFVAVEAGDERAVQKCLKLTKQFERELGHALRY